jgi:hypothetical protein
MMMRLVGIALLLLSTAASAEVYRWVDAQGRVHYADRPAENAELVSSVASRPTNREDVAKRTEAESAQRAQAAARETEQSAQQATAAAVEQDVEKNRAIQCKKAQEDYRVAVESQKLYRVGKDGERYYLTDAELTEARVNSRRAMDELCKPAS